METGVCKICGSTKTSITMIGGSTFKWCHACGQTSLRQTYADRIRSMSDEELAELLYETETQYLPIGLHVENGWPECLKKEVDND